MMITKQYIFESNMSEYKIKIELLNQIIKDIRFGLKNGGTCNRLMKEADKYVIDNLECWKQILKDEDNWKEPDIKDSINEVIKHLKEGYITEEHRHSELNWACVECQARILEGGLEMLKDQLDDSEEEDDIDDDVNHL